MKSRCRFVLPLQWILALVLLPAAAFAQPLRFSHLAGPLGGPGLLDGPGSSAEFNTPNGVAGDASGNIYVADTFNNVIRKISSEGLVTTFAGSGSFGKADGQGTAASFIWPSGVAVDGSGTVYVADTYNSVIRKITPGGLVTTLAGSGSPGGVDGLGTAASFRNPTGVALDTSGNIYVADTDNHQIRKITPRGLVSTLAGSGSPGSADGQGMAASFNTPAGLAIDGSGHVYVADTHNNKIRKISPGGLVTTLAGSGNVGRADGQGTAASFIWPSGVAVDGSGDVYVADTQNNEIRKISPTGLVTTYAGSGSHGTADGQGTAAAFSFPGGIALDTSENLYVADAHNHKIRKISPSGLVVTLAGSGGEGAEDGAGTAATFNSPVGIAMVSSGEVFVADGGSNKIRRVSSAGLVTTFAGSGDFGSADGQGTAASFSFPSGIALDTSGNVYVADSWNNMIRKISPGGLVTTLAGSGNVGGADGQGTNASFFHPFGVAVDASGNVYVADSWNNKIRKISQSGVVTTFAGSGSQGSADGQGTAASFNAPLGVAVDGFGSVYVADSWNKIRKISPSGLVTTLAGSEEAGSADGQGAAASFYFPRGPAVDGFGNVYVADYGNNKIRKVTPGGLVTTVGGSGQTGSTDGTGMAATFNEPAGIAVDGSGNVYVTDSENNAIRVGTPVGLAGFVPIVLDVSGFAHYTSELQLTNLGPSSTTVSLSYTSSIGSGSGSVQAIVPAGQQVVYPDAISFLRDGRVPIPTSGDEGGTLLLSSSAPGIHATVHTGADTVPPQPEGRSGLAYSDVDPAVSASSTTVYVYGLRTNTSDRSNLAVYNMGADPISLKVTLVSGESGSSYDLTGSRPLSLRAFGWYQYADADALQQAGFASGYAIIQRVGGTGPFGAYGVVNDQTTNDGSFIPALSEAVGVSALTIPVLVETGTFESELILVNRGDATATFTLQYFESLSPTNGRGGTTTLTVPARQQNIIPHSLDFLRSKGVSIGPRGQVSYGGSVQIQVSGVDFGSVFAGARTASLSSAGGEYGVFYPAVSSNQMFGDAAFVLGLKADADSRSNVAAVNAGDPRSGSITLELQVLDGSNGGVATGPSLSVNLSPGAWTQPPGFFAAANVPNGYVRIRRTAGTAPWFAYGVINDGGSPGQRTGDGSYVQGVMP